MASFTPPPLPARYQLLEPLGEGGMSAVFHGLDTLVQRPCAIKFIKPEYFENSELLKRFFAEAQVTAAVSHPNIIQILDLSQDPQNPYFVMEKFSATNLLEWSQKEPRSLSRLLPIFKQIARALRAAHKVKLIHRDIKPENILINDEDHIKIIDWGLSKFQSEDTNATNFTRPGTVMGTGHYMSPEQARGLNIVGPPTDIYAAGVTFFFLSTGATPFNGESFMDLLLAHCKEARPKAHGRNPQVPERLSSLIEKMMAIEVGQRPTAEETLADLDTIDSPTPQTVLPRAPETPKTPSGLTPPGAAKTSPSPSKTIGPEISMDRAQLQGGCYFYNSIPFNGTLFIRGSDGKIIEKFAVVKGKRQGSAKKWYPSGELFQDWNYFEGQLHGTCLSFHKNGAPMQEETFSHARKEGIRRQWYEDGTLWMESTFAGDLPDGLSTTWHRNGVKAQEMTFHRGRNKGITREWAEDGSLKREKNHDTGVEKKFGP